MLMRIHSMRIHRRRIHRRCSRGLNAVFRGAGCDLTFPSYCRGFHVVTTSISISIVIIIISSSSISIVYIHVGAVR